MAYLLLSRDPLANRHLAKERLTKKISKIDTNEKSKETEKEEKS